MFEPVLNDAVDFSMNITLSNIDVSSQATRPLPSRCLGSECWCQCSALTLCGDLWCRGNRTGQIPVETLQKTNNLTKIVFACIETYVIIGNNMKIQSS